MNALDWNTVYLTCFGIGLTLTVLSFTAGIGHWHAGHFHFGHGHGHSFTKVGHSVSPFNGFTMVAFLCWFGGAGYLFYRFSPFASALVLGFALLSGLAGASLIFWFLTKVLMPMERTLEPADTEMTGVIGKLSSGIPASGVGEILYSQNGARRSAAVRADDGAAIERGAEVIVMRYQRGIAYVRRWDEFEQGLMGMEEDAGKAKETSR